MREVGIGIASQHSKSVDAIDPATVRTRSPCLESGSDDISELCFDICAHDPHRVDDRFELDRVVNELAGQFGLLDWCVLWVNGRASASATRR